MIITRLIGLIFSLCISSVFFPSLLYAQTSQSLSVTPPLFQVSLAPSDVWQSSVKVVNNNPYELTVYAEVVNFESIGESGQGKFVPILNDDGADKATLAEWINIPAGPYTIKPEQSGDIQFFVDIPATAPPGGHFAAILISTEPPADSGAVAVRTSQVVTSLFFVRIAGDTVESGSIREFSVDDSFVDTPQTTFSLRFENKGNVLLQPRGNIVVTNMWGKERGNIAINNQTRFGNVLPKTIREFTFPWKGEPSLADIGRYKAVATLAFGEEGSQNVDSTTYFWVIPLRATIITIVILLAFVALVTWGIKSYVRRMLMLAGVDVDMVKKEPRASRLQTYEDDVRISPYARATLPIRSKAKSLRKKLSEVREKRHLIVTLLSFVQRYKIFFVVAIIGIIALVTLLVFSVRVITSIVSSSEQSEPTISERADSESLLKERLEETVSKPTTTPATIQPFTLVIVNASGEAGAAARIAIALEADGYVVKELKTDTNPEPRLGTAIIYDEEVLDEANKLSRVLGGALISSRPKAENSDEGMPLITVIVGKDKPRL